MLFVNILPNIHGEALPENA